MTRTKKAVSYTGEQKSKKMRKELEALPSISDKILNSGSPILYLEARLAQLNAIMEENDIDMQQYENDRFGILTSGKLQSQIIKKYGRRGFMGKMPFYLVDETIKIFPTTAQYFTMHLGNMKDINNVTIHLGYLDGVVYDQPVSRKHFEIRWTLQIQDNLSEQAAEDVASRL